MYKNVKQGWYTLKHPEKYLHPIDEYMQSTFKDKVMYKSSLELKFLKYKNSLLFFPSTPKRISFLSSRVLVLLFFCLLLLFIITDSKIPPERKSVKCL